MLGEGGHFWREQQEQKQRQNDSSLHFWGSSCVPGTGVSTAFSPHHPRGQVLFGGQWRLSDLPGSHSSLTQSHTVPCFEELLFGTNMGRGGDGEGEKGARSIGSEVRGAETQTDLLYHIRSLLALRGSRKEVREEEVAWTPGPRAHPSH